MKKSYNASPSLLLGGCPNASANSQKFSKKSQRGWDSAKIKGKWERAKRRSRTQCLERPPSGFFLFFAEHRPQIKGGHPGLSFCDVAKKLGAMWINADDRQPCEKMAAKLKEKYKKHIAAYGVEEKRMQRNGKGGG
ncbi:high mobility group protein B1 [Sigmodon hispidus]